MFKDKSRKELLAEIPMAKNKIFPYNQSESHALKATLDVDNWLWHHRYGHLNFRSLSLLSEHKMVDGLPVIKHSNDICESCVAGKQHRDSFPKGEARRATKPVKLIHADVCGPMKTASLNNSRYLIVFVDD